jgi:hypothetical protein
MAVRYPLRPRPVNMRYWAITSLPGREKFREVGLEKRRDEPARSRIHVQRNVQAALTLQPVERVGDLCERLVAAIERGAEDRDHPDRVLVAPGDRLLRAEVKALALHRDQPWFNVPVAAELLPADLDVGAHHEIRVIGRFAGVTHTPAPAPP